MIWSVGMFWVWSLLCFCLFWLPSLASAFVPVVTFFCTVVISVDRVYDTVMVSIMSLLVSLTMFMSGSSWFGRSMYCFLVLSVFFVLLSMFVTMFVLSVRSYLLFVDGVPKSLFDCTLGRLTRYDGSCCRLVRTVLLFVGIVSAVY